MHRSPYRAILIALILAVGSFAVAACGSDDDEGSGGSSASSTSTAAKPAAKKIKVGLVTDINQLSDRGFNHLAYVGLLRAQKRDVLEAIRTEIRRGMEQHHNELPMPAVLSSGEKI